MFFSIHDSSTLKANLTSKFASRVSQFTMQFLTASTILYVRVILLLCLAFMLVKNPAAIVKANFTLILGQAMHLPTVHASDTNPLFGILSIFIASSAISDLIPCLAENIAYFETLVPTRLTFFFLLGSFCLISEFGIIANNLVFTYSFIEIWLNFLIYNNLRDEKYYRAKKFLEEHGDELREEEGERVVPVE